MKSPVGVTINIVKISGSSKIGRLHTIEILNIEIGIKDPIRKRDVSIAISYSVTGKGKSHLSRLGIQSCSGKWYGADSLSWYELAILTNSYPKIINLISKIETGRDRIYPTEISSKKTVLNFYCLGFFPDSKALVSIGWIGVDF